MEWVIYSIWFGCGIACGFMCRYLVIRNTLKKYAYEFIRKEFRKDVETFLQIREENKHGNNKHSK